ncbi:hypothetical protein SO802_000376 [Lithocarpus litseifolius]|uniref:Uncharacterized protein n=1 Tax=Lithocarpus litseifolius TaxID=425828 RepID=A0AAW2DU46_9ROSI
MERTEGEDRGRRWSGLREKIEGEDGAWSSVGVTVRAVKCACDEKMELGLRAVKCLKNSLLDITKGHSTVSLESSLSTSNEFPGAKSSDLSRSVTPFVLL